MMRLALAFGFALSLASSGCGIVSSDTSSTETKNALTIQVSKEPPADKAEGTKPAAPGFGYIWVAGYWDYLDGNYVWRDGRWVQGKQDYEYVRARYENVGNGWVFHRPHWKKRHTEATPAAAPPAAAPQS
jgi:hypothetical protein